MNADSITAEESEEESAVIGVTEEQTSIYPNMIGGISLFPKAVTKNADNIYLSSDNLPVAYASNDVSATANTRRRSMNLTESKALENGYRYSMLG